MQSTTSAPELQIRAEVWTRNDTSQPFTLQAVKWAQRSPGVSYFVLDLSSILQGVLSFDRVGTYTGPGQVSPNPGSIAEYKLQLIEVFYNASGVPTDYTTLWTAVYRAVNAIPQHQEDQTMTDYIISGNQGTGGFGDGFGDGFN